MNPFILDPFDI